MRGLEVIDSELRLLAAVRWSIREHGGEPTNRHVDELLDERLAVSVPTDTVAGMLSKRVIRVTLTAITEEAGAGLTSFVGTPLWRVEWTEIRGTKTDTMAHSHYTEVAARQHVKGLLEQVDPALGNVYTEEA